MSDKAYTSAFPTYGEFRLSAESGMTLRQWYAGQALAGMLARDYYPPEGAAFGAFMFADAMLEAEK